MDPVAPGFAEHLAEVLGHALTPIADEATALRGDLSVAEAERRKANAINTGVLAVLVILVAALIAIGVVTLRSADETRQTNARIADCTAPTGACYRDGQTRTQMAVNDLIWASIYTSECGRERPGDSGPAFDAYLETCVAQRFTQRHAGATPPPSTPVPTRPAPSRTR